MADSVSRSLAKGAMPLFLTNVSSSITIPTAPEPTISPWRRLSKGRAASDNFSVVVAAPDAINPAKAQSCVISFVISSAAMITTLLAFPVLIHASAV